MKMVILRTRTNALLHFCRVWVTLLLLNNKVLSGSSFSTPIGNSFLSRPEVAINLLSDRSSASIARESRKFYIESTESFLRPEDVAGAVKKEHTHILVLPGFAASSKDYTKKGSLVPNLISRGGWNETQIHVLPCKILDWAQVPLKGMMNPQFVAAVSGKGEGLAADQLPYRWYLQRVATAIRKIDSDVKAQYGTDAQAKVIIIGHSAGGWLARAAIGHGTEHWQKRSMLEPIIGINIDNILAIITLGTPNNPPPKGAQDMTGGAQRITSERFPGAYFEDKLFYVSIAGTGKSVRGGGAVDSDGVVPATLAHLEGASHQITLQNISHAPHLTENWYGSDDRVNAWFGSVLTELDYIQNANGILTENTEQPKEKQVVFENKEKGSIEDYFRRRNALRHTAIWDNVTDQLVLERLIYAMEEIPIPQNDIVFLQGEEADSLYFIQSGSFECYSEETGEVITTLGKNAVFGELGVLLGEPRALSVRAASSDAVVYRLSKLDVEKHIKQDENALAASNLLNVGKYEKYFDDMSKRDALNACPVFDALGETDVKRLIGCMKTRAVSAGEKIIEEGTEGNAMYFVADGSFQCYRESTSHVLKTCAKGDYFGELGVIFNKPRAASVVASHPSVVWELEGDAFLDCYNKATIHAFGAASWVLHLLKVTRADKWGKRLIPRALSSRWQLLKLALGRGLWDRIRLHNTYSTKLNCFTGASTHVFAAMLCIIIPLWFHTSKAVLATSSLTRHIMNAGFAGIMYDNFVNSFGKYIGEGKRLRQLCKVRYVFYGIFITLLFNPIIESSVASGLLPSKALKVSTIALSLIAGYEAIDRLRFDIGDMRIMDRRDEVSNSGHSVAGTLQYSSGKVMKNILPIVILNLFSIAIGSLLWRKGTVSGPWLFFSGVITLLMSGTQKPTLQCYSEPLMVGMIWASSAGLPFPM